MTESSSTSSASDTREKTPIAPRSTAVAMVGVSAIVLALAFYMGWGTPALPSNYYAVCSHHQAVYTVDATNSRVECLVIRDSYIVQTGSLAEIQTIPNVAIRFIPTDAIVVPGLSDSHGHLLEYGASKQLPLEGTNTVNDTVARVREYILSNPSILNNPEAFIRGGGWDHTSWPGEAWPTAADLEADDIIRGRPVILQSKDCHAKWVSRRVLELSPPVESTTIDGGVVVMDEQMGVPSVFLDKAQDLLYEAPLTEAEQVSRFTRAVNDALAYGLTSVHDAGLDPESMEFFIRQAENGVDIPIRIYAMRAFNTTSSYWGNSTRPFVGVANGRLTARSVKIFADGALRTGGSAVIQLHEPYADHPHTRGFMLLDPEVLFEFIPWFLRDGWQVNVHAIGDRANGIVLDAFEAALEGVNVTALRPRLEHAQLMTREDMERLGKLGVIASVQPTHAISDMWYAEDRLGPERVKGLYAFRSLLSSGAKITLGSDFPVEDMNPLTGFYAAITRVSFDGNSPHGPDGWFPEERLTRIEALRGMTIDPAYASFTETQLGSLEVGKFADFVVLERDIMEIEARDVLNTRVLATVVDGRVVYGAL
ncbi:amidohydrolase family-domain-containing protein [Roridomyces roridus]|uniref:Amidohydrolase family-domain-containing protein n=1 Tax=Roridomyces roridus TaxID=1738132 RepID=A0AAD7FBF5_9AGAR|nr:amidohydrolase family-domain-containing protein [Roridomyces roridus]